MKLLMKMHNKSFPEIENLGQAIQQALYYETLPDMIEFICEWSKYNKSSSSFQG